MFFVSAHFANCGGKINITDSIFMNQLDEGANIHCFYRYHINVNGNHLLLAGYYQQLGVRIENNKFHTPGCAIKFDGDAKFWYEGGTVIDAVICDNSFENCLYNYSGRNAVIDIYPNINTLLGEFYHYNISVENNDFLDSHHKAVYAKNSYIITVCDNRWHFDNTSNIFAGEGVIWEKCGRGIVKNNGFQAICFITRVVKTLSPKNKKTTQHFTYPPNCKRVYNIWLHSYHQL